MDVIIIVIVNHLLVPCHIFECFFFCLKAGHSMKISMLIEETNITPAIYISSTFPLLPDDIIQNDLFVACIEE
jgi:hypothetical protein